MMTDSSKKFTYEAVIFTGKKVCFTDKTMKLITTTKRVKFAKGSVKIA